MLKEQKRYEFRQELLQIHKKDVIDERLVANNDEFAFTDGMIISIPKDCSDVVRIAVEDFIDFLMVSMNVAVCVTKKQTNCQIQAKIGKNLGNADGYMGFRITTTKKSISIDGYDERGIAQAFYYLEDRMNIRKAPFIQIGTIERKAMFSPRITQSPFGMYDFSDYAFSQMAHKGFDAIDLWLKDPYTDKRGYQIDVNFIAQRAFRYGIDVYVELYAPHDKHPDDEGAQEYYDNLYGKLYSVCPIIKGVVLVGEANQFKSKDERVGKTPFMANFEENIPTGKTSPGWWPCRDYPAWVSLINNAVKKYRADAQVVFCTYNWGYAPEKDRVKLINNLPSDVALMATWDMFHKYKVGDSVEDVCDYTLSFVGPGEYFLSEAKTAKARGIKMFTIANSAGKTWDFGTIPYEPMAQQWIKRYQNMRNANKELNLCGVLENIHYGFHPSIISELEKVAFFSPDTDLNLALMELAKRDFGDGYEKAIKAMEYLSLGIEHYVPTNEDQYGAFRIGPAYPLWSQEENGLPVGLVGGGKKPSHPHAMFGNSIYFGTYTIDNGGKSTLPGIRIYDEIKSLEKMREYFEKAIDLINSVSQPTDKLLRLKNMIEYMLCTCITGINVKKHYILKQKLTVVGDRKKAEKIIDELNELLVLERQNALNAIPLVRKDSLLGYEPSMEYIGDEECILWKIRQIDYELSSILPKYRLENNLKV